MSSDTLPNHAESATFKVETERNKKVQFADLLTLSEAFLQRR